MPNQTTNYGLVKPLYNETADIAVINQNMDAIDSQLNVIESTAEHNNSELIAHKADEVQHITYAIAAGAANSYTVTLNPAPDAYIEGFAVAIKINTNNTGASTVNVNVLGAKAIKKPNGNDVSAGNLKAGSIYTLRYNGVNFILQGEGGEYGSATAAEVLEGYTLGTEGGVVNGALALSGDALPANVLAGKTFYNTNAKSKLTGTIPSKGSQTYTPGTTNQIIAGGQYLINAQTILGDAELKAENIKAGINLFDIIGTMNPSRTASGRAENNLFDTFSVLGETDTEYCRYLEITNLIFTPNIVIIGDSWLAFYNTITPNKAVYLYTSTSSPAVLKAFKLEPPAYISASGFKIPMYNAGFNEFDWFAAAF